MLYVIIREGDDPETARPLAVIRDPFVIRRMAEALQERLLHASQEGNAPTLRFLKHVVEQEQEADGE